MYDEILAMEPGKGNRVLELGAARDDVLRRLADAGFEAEEDCEEDGKKRWYFVEELATDLAFSAGPNPVLLEIAVSSEHFRLGPIALVDEPVGEVVETLKVANEETLWTHDSDDLYDAEPEDASGDEADGEDATASGATPTDEALLKGATLWIRPFGLGLDLVYGDVLTVKLRRPSDVPAKGIGPLTAEQRALALREDLSSKLVGVTRTAIPQPRQASRFQRYGMLVVFLALGLVIWRGAEYQLRWNRAPVAKADILAVNPPPPEPFPEEYTVAYDDHLGARHEAVIDRDEVYGIPALGEKLDVHFLPEAPDEPLGTARMRDIAFEKYLPWGIGVVVAYFVLFPILGYVERTRHKPASA